MNLSRLSADLWNILWTSKQAGFCFNKLLLNVAFRKRYYSSTVATLDQSVLDQVENEWRHVLGKVKHCGNAIFVLGPMGAGKTTTIENCFKTHEHFRHYAYVDTDEIMGSIDAFTADKVEQYYPLARKLAIKLTDWILTEKISFVAEGTCVKYDELIEYMKRLKDSGYNIHVNRLPSVSLDVILQRSKHRRNRIIADDVVASIYENANRGLEELYEYNKRHTLFEDLDLTVYADKKNHVKPLCVR